MRIGWWATCCVTVALSVGCTAPSFWVPVGSSSQDVTTSGFDDDPTGFVVVGTDDSGADTGAERLFKYDASGRSLWVRTLALDSWPTNDVDVTALPSGEYLVCGRAAEGYPSPNEHLVLAKLDSSGDPLWITTFAENQLERASCRSVAVNAQGGFDVVYWGYGWDSGDPIAYVLRRMDANGAEVWTRTLQLEPYRGLNGIPTVDGGFAYVMTVESTDPLPSPPDHDPRLVKLDDQGVPEWERTYPRDFLDELPGSIRQTADGGFLLAGQVYVYYPDQNPHVWVRKTDAAGVEEWVSDVANDVYTKGGSAVENPAGGYVVRANRNGETNQAFPELLELDLSGQVTSMTIFGAPNCHVDGSGLKVTSDGAFAFLAHHYPPSSSHPHYLVKSGPGVTPPDPPADCG